MSADEGGTGRLRDAWAGTSGMAASRPDCPDIIGRARDLDRPEYLVPAKALAALPPGARLLWQVEATAPDGSRATSSTFVNPLD